MRLTVPMQLRSAATDDLEAVLALVQSAYRGESSRAGWTTEADLLDGPRIEAPELLSLLPHIIVAEDAGEVVGCCLLQELGDHAHFGLFAVRPTLQGGGVGSLLLTEAERRAAALGVSHVEMTVLTVREDVLAFYERRGYADTGVRSPLVHAAAIPRRDDLELMLPK